MARLVYKMTACQECISFNCCQWMNNWIIDYWMMDSMNECMNECINKGMDEWMTELMNKSFICQYFIHQSVMILVEVIFGRCNITFSNFFKLSVSVLSTSLFRFSACIIDITLSSMMCTVWSATWEWWLQHCQQRQLYYSLPVLLI